MTALPYRASRAPRVARFRRNAIQNVLNCRARDFTPRKVQRDLIQELANLASELGRDSFTLTWQAGHGFSLRSDPLFIAPDTVFHRHHSTAIFEWSKQKPIRNYQGLRRVA